MQLVHGLEQRSMRELELELLVLGRTVLLRQSATGARRLRPEQEGEKDKVARGRAVLTPEAEEGVRPPGK